jgi:hypothetical protein
MKTAWACLVLATAALDANALGRFAEVQVLDRETGAVLPTYRYHGEYWVAGTPGSRYSISIRNNRGERLLAVTTVDGVNVITGESGAFGQSGYVYDSGETYPITGWRKSDQEIAAFEFTALPDSYAALTGRPANVGVIGVALFLERPAPPPVAQYAAPRGESRSRFAENGANAGAVPSAPALAGAQSAQSKQADAMSALTNQTDAALSAPNKGSSAAPLRQPAPTAKLGTGHGAREASVVFSTQFERLTSTPNEIVRIRYDSWANLLAMGVVQPRRAVPGAPNAFPDSAVSQYVPDPPSNVPMGRR